MTRINGQTLEISKCRVANGPRAFYGQSEAEHSGAVAPSSASITVGNNSQEDVMGGPYRCVTKEEFDRLTAAGVRGDWAEGCGYIVYDEQADKEFQAALAAQAARFVASR